MLIIYLKSRKLAKFHYLNPGSITEAVATAIIKWLMSQRSEIVGTSWRYITLENSFKEKKKSDLNVYRNYIQTPPGVDEAMEVKFHFTTGVVNQVNHSTIYCFQHFWVSQEHLITYTRTGTVSIMAFSSLSNLKA